jgi:hypothetical protein
MHVKKNAFFKADKRRDYIFLETPNLAAAVDKMAGCLTCFRVSNDD